MIHAGVNSPIAPLLFAMAKLSKRGNLHERRGARLLLGGSSILLVIIVVIFFATSRNRNSVQAADRLAKVSGVVAFASPGRVEGASETRRSELPRMASSKPCT